MHFYIKCITYDLSVTLHGEQRDVEFMSVTRKSLQPSFTLVLIYKVYFKGLAP